MSKYFTITTVSTFSAMVLLVAARADAGGSQSAPLKYTNTSQVAQGTSDNQRMRGDKTISEFSSSSAPVSTPPWLVAPARVPHQCWVKTDDRGYGYYVPC